MNGLYVFLGGGLGSLARYALTVGLERAALSFPLATLVANVVASFFIGVLVGLSLRDTTRLFWATGFCGGFSTFSSFSNETLTLFQQGNSYLAFFNILLNVAICLTAVFFGILIVK
ncbi:MAG: fluoride efflux transporter CrcB [Saprospiraceae bacterium]|nr:fluoride efflux transporter CrcB [Saprospiraceae bacterium]